MKKKKREMF